MPHITDSQIHELLKVKLGHEVSQEALAIAHGRGWIAEVHDEPNPNLALNKVVGKIRKLPGGGRVEEIVAPATDFEPSRRRAPGDQEDARLEALARILVLEARQQPRVLAFRREVLGGKLVSPERIPAWLRRKEREQGKPTTFIRVPLDELGEPILDEDALLTGTVSNRWIQELLYFHPAPGASRPDQIRVVDVALRTGSVLWRLRDLAKWLADVYCWKLSRAIAFVLSDQVPRLALGRATINRNHWWVDLSHEPEERRSALDRIHMTLDLRMTADQVGELFLAAREGAWKTEAAERQPRIRAKPMTPELAQLAAFVVEHNDGRTWERARAAWNRRYPKRAYRGGVPNFISAARAAYKRVTGVPLKWKRGRGHHA